MIRQNTIIKVLSLCEDLWMHSQDHKGFDDAATFSQTHKVSPGYIALLKNLGYIQQLGSTKKWKWATEAPTRDMAIRLIQAINNKSKGNTLQAPTITANDVPDGMVLVSEAIATSHHLLSVAERYHIKPEMYPAFVKEMMQYIFLDRKEPPAELAEVEHTNPSKDFIQVAIETPVPHIHRKVVGGK